VTNLTSQIVRQETNTNGDRIASRKLFKNRKINEQDGIDLTESTYKLTFFFLINLYYFTK
jgi:hypothetical protein